MNRLKYLILLICIFYVQTVSFAQTNPSMLTVKGFRLSISNNDTLFVNGNVHIVENSDMDDNIHNEGLFTITDTLFNSVNNLFLSSSNPFLSNDTNDIKIFLPSIGKTTFQSNKNKLIRGNPSIYFNNLTVKQGCLVLDTNIKVIGEIELDLANFNLNGNNIELFDTAVNINKKTGKIKAGTETNLYKIFGDSSGYIKAAKYYSNVSGSDPANFGFSIISPDDIGDIFISRYHFSDTTVTDGGIKKSYVIQNNYGNLGNNKDLQFSYFESDLVDNDTSLRVFFKAIDSNRFKYLGGALENTNSIKAKNVNFNEGYYTIADSICDNPPKVNIGTDQIICEGSRIELRADTIYNDEQKKNMTYKWWSSNHNIGNSTDFNLIIPYDTINKYLNDTIDIHLMVADERGCINRDTVRFYTFPNPRLGIKVSSPFSNICMGDTIAFLDTLNSTGKYKWTFLQENYFESISNPSYVYHNQEGMKEVEVIFTDINGCNADSIIRFNVHPLPEPKFAVDLNNCLGDELILDNQSFISTSIISGAIAKYTWDLGNNNIINVTQDTVISDSTLRYISTKLTGNGGMPGPDLIYYYNKTGTYDIKLTAETYSGCVSDTIISTNIRDSVYAAFDTTSYTNVCLGMISRFFPQNSTSDTSLVAEYQWHFNDSIIKTYSLYDTVNYKFATAGTFDVNFVVVSKYGCTDTVMSKVKIYSSPLAIFTIDPVCLNSISLFNSFGSSNTSMNYKWFVEDSIIYSSANEAVNYFFKEVGDHKVILEVANENGCKSFFTDTAIVVANPEANFIIQNACINNQIGDTLIKNISNNISSTYHWDFGDGYTSDIEHPNKSFINAGIYPIKLTASKIVTINNSNITCKANYSDTIKIYDIAPADFKVDYNTNVCEGNSSEFLLSNYTNSGLVDHYTWIFNSDTIKSYTSDQISYQFETDGKYSVTLRTVTKDGCSDFKTKQVTIYDTPEIDIVSDSACLGEELNFSVNENNRYSNTEYNWYLGNLIGNGWYVSANKSEPGLYEVILEIKTPNGCINRDTSYAIVHPLPIDLFQNQIHVCSDTLKLLGENPNYDYLWNNTISGNVFTVYNDGVYKVKVTDKYTGCESNEDIEILLNKPLNVELGNDTSACGNLKLDAGFFGQSATYLWSNGSTGRYLNVNSNDEYKVTVNQGGCSVSDSIQVIVNEIPVIDLGSDINTCAFETVFLNAEITDGKNYLWSNGLTSGIIEVTSEVAQSNNYKVIVTDVNNCITTDQIKVTFNPVPLVDLGIDIEICQNKNIALNATTVNATNYLWNTGETTSVIFPNETGSDVISKEYFVLVENKYGCNVTDTVRVKFLPVPEVILPEEMVACGNEVITLSAYNPKYISYMWNNGSNDSIITVSTNEGDGIYYVNIENQFHCVSTSNQSNIAFKNIPVAVLPENITGCNKILLNAGNFGADFLWNDQQTFQQRIVYQSGLYTVKITNGNNCAIIDSVNAIVNYVTKPYLGPDISLCVNDQKVLRTGIHDPAYTFEWNGYSTGDTMLIATQGKYIVKAINYNGCEDSDTINVIGRALPDVYLGPDMYKCTDDNFILDAGDDGFAYYWGSSSGLESGERFVEVADTGKYWVKVTNDFGCMQSDTINIEPTSLSIDPLFITNSKLIAGDSVLFVDMSQPEPMSWLWEFGDLQQSIYQNPIHVYYGSGDYQVILHVSNAVCNASIIKIIEVEQRNKTGEEDGDIEELIGDKFIGINNVKIYPNPNNGNFTIEADLSTRTNANVYIFNLMGQLISVKKYSNVLTLNEYIDIQSKSPGIYIIKIIAGTDYKTYKIIKQ